MRSRNVPVPADTRYFAVNVFDPAVRDVSMCTADARIDMFAKSDCSHTLLESDADTDDAPDTVYDIKLDAEAVSLAMRAATMTMARVPVVTVTVGPVVPRSVKLVDELVWAVVMELVVGVRAARALAAVETRICPEAVTFAGPVSKILSRTDAFHCAAVKVLLLTAVSGVEYAITASP